MKHPHFTQRPGSTLIELMIYLVILGIIIGIILPLLFAASEDRLLQQTISVVEQNGTQILQDLSLRIRNSERILAPAKGATGSVLVLQTASGATNPTIIGLESGSIILIEGTKVQTITSTQIAVINFTVRNTSTSASHQSADIYFTISRTTRLEQPRYYIRYYDTDVSLFPDDIQQANSLSCSAPYCSPANIYNWQVYNSNLNQCLDAQLPLICSP